MMRLHDAGLATDYWKQYYDADEIEELEQHTASTQIISGKYPVHIRLFPHGEHAPTVVIANSMLGYGLCQARWQLPFFRAGFNVVQFDFPGLGQSGGPRGGCTVSDFLKAWVDAVAYARGQFGSPLFAMGVAEDGIACYHALANHPHIEAISVHALFNYGEPEGVGWMGPTPLIRAAAFGTTIGSLLRPTLSVPGTRTVPWNDVFAGPGDDRLIRIMEYDPLTLKKVELRMSKSVMQRRPPRVPFEDCRTPVQLIASTHNKLWAYDMVTRNHEQLGGPKELITLEGKPMWELNREFSDTYCSHVINWFRLNSAFQTGDGHGVMTSDMLDEASTPGTIR